MTVVRNFVEKNVVSKFPFLFLWPVVFPPPNVFLALPRLYTVGARIPNVFGIQMVVGVWFLNGVWNSNGWPFCHKWLPLRPKPFQNQTKMFRI